jgi:hypothetical protein
MAVLDRPLVVRRKRLPDVRPGAFIGQVGARFSLRGRVIHYLVH